MLILIIHALQGAITENTMILFNLAHRNEDESFKFGIFRKVILLSNVN